MTESTDLVIWSDARADAVLDAAADLLVRWGYRRVTVDEVARQACVGKGTVYLHFRSKEALFLTVLLRSHHTLVSALADRMDANPAEALPSRLMRSVYLDVARDPVARPLYLGDGELLGRLAREAAATLGGIATRRDVLAHDHFKRLRAEGCLRTDLPLDHQLHVLSAVGSGFFFVDGTPGAPTDPADRAALLAHTVAAALETGRAPSPALARAVAAGYRTLTAHIQDEARRRG
jgi:AcrR family transcriptional regulator